MKLPCTLTILAFIAGLTVVLGGRRPELHGVKRTTEDEFDLRIKEKGAHFDETMEFNKEDNTVLFRVPAHNDVSKSDVLMDFNLKLIITRLVDEKMCHVRPLDLKTSPTKMEGDLEKVIRYQERKPTRIRSGMEDDSSEWGLDKLLSKTDLSASVRRFCVGLPVYSLKKVEEDGVVVTEVGASSIRKRQNNGFALCPGQQAEAGKCNPNAWILTCKFPRAGRTCVYWATCAQPAGPVNGDFRKCSFNHQWNSVICCNVKCP